MLRAILILLCLSIAPLVHAGVEDPPTMDQARRHLDRSRWDRAIEAYRAIVEHDEDNGMAWFYLAYCLHNGGELEAAIEANRTGLEHGAPIAATLYNLACCYEVSGDVVLAEETLAEAIEAGFLDFDQIASDSELAKVRARGRVELPARHEFKTNKGRNGVLIPYELILPENHDPERTYPAVAVFSPGYGPLSASWVLENLCGGVTRKQDCIVLVLVAPERGWWTHPTHHALEDLLKKVKKEYRVEGDAFHLVGIHGGARPAATYSGMSGKYFQSFSILGGRPMEDRDDSDVKSARSLRCAFVVGDRDPGAEVAARRAQSLLQAAGGMATVRVLPDEGGALPGLNDGLWLKLLVEELELGSS